MKEGLEELLRNPNIWRGGENLAERSTISTGYAGLDAILPGGGWPTRALTEILVEHSGVGELQLVMPALARLTQDDDSPAVWIVWVAPPHIPYAPALLAWNVRLSRVLLVHPRTLEEALWAMEQALRSGTSAAVLAWVEQTDERRIRRLQLAAEEGGCWGILFRPLHARIHNSPAALRLCLVSEHDGARIEVIKGRGGRPREIHTGDLGVQHFGLPPEIPTAGTSG